MKKKIISCVYEIRSTVTGKHYVGSAVDFDSRRSSHLSDLKSAKSMLSLGFKAGYVQDCCRGVRDSCKGYKFAYKKNFT